MACGVPLVRSGAAPRSRDTRRGISAAAVLAVACALLACSPALAAGTRETSVSVLCGASVVVSQPATCTVTVTDTTVEGTPTAPTGKVKFESNTSGGSFSGGATCPLAAVPSTIEAKCNIEYTPGKVGSGAHTITAAYDGADGVHAAKNGEGTLAVSAPPAPPPTTTTTTTTTTPASPAPAIRPASPKCRLMLNEQSKLLGAGKTRARKVRVPVLLVRYTCDQNASVHIGGVVTIAATRHGRKVTKARSIALAAVSSRAIAGKPAPGVVLALPTLVSNALSAGVKTIAAVTFTVKNPNGTGLATLKLTLVPLSLLGRHG